MWGQWGQLLGESKLQAIGLCWFGFALLSLFGSLSGSSRRSLGIPGSRSSLVHPSPTSAVIVSTGHPCRSGSLSPGMLCQFPAAWAPLSSCEPRPPEQTVRATRGTDWPGLPCPVLETEVDRGTGSSQEHLRVQGIALGSLLSQAGMAVPQPSETLPGHHLCDKRRQLHALQR